MCTKPVIILLLLPVIIPGRGVLPRVAAAVRFWPRGEFSVHLFSHLSGNVGYVKFNGFPDPEVCGATAVAAMNFLANVDALIFDLRQNGGGDPKMIALLCSYLFATPTHLNDLWTRKGTPPRFICSRPALISPRSVSG